jgi:hypothetical protein
VTLHLFQTSTVNGNEWSASRPGRFSPRERASGTHWVGWVGSRAVLDAVVKRKIPSPRRCMKMQPKFEPVRLNEECTGNIQRSKLYQLVCNSNSGPKEKCGSSMREPFPLPGIDIYFNIE